MSRRRPTEIEEVGITGQPQDADVRRPIALELLFKGTTRQRLVEFFLLDADPDVKYYKASVSNQIDVARDSVRRNIDELVRFGVLGKTEGEKMRYFLRDGSDVVEHIRALDEALWERYVAINGDDPPERMALTHLFKYKTPRRLLTYFVDRADPGEWVNKSQLGEAVGVSRESVRQRYGLLLDYDLIENDTDGRELLTARRDDPLYADIIDLNNHLAAAYKSRESLVE